MSYGTNRRRHDSKNLTDTPIPFLSHSLGTEQDRDLLSIRSTEKSLGERRLELNSTLNPSRIPRIIARKPKKIKGNFGLKSQRLRPPGDHRWVNECNGDVSPITPRKPYRNRYKPLLFGLATLVSCRSGHRPATCSLTLRSSDTSTCACRLSPSF